MSIKKNKNQLIISILVGIAIFAVTYQFVIKLHEENEKLKNGIGVNTVAIDKSATVYVAAKNDLAKGQIISAEDVELKDTEMKIDGVYKETESIIGAKVLKDITAGMPVSKGSIQISNGYDGPKPGFRAVMAPISASRVPPFVEDGIYLDLYTAENTIQVSNVRVIRVLDSSSKSSKLIVFEIREEDVNPFIFGMTKDKLIPVQKNKDDNSEYSFAYDPFKYSSYTISNEELTEELKNMDSIPSDNYIPANNMRRKTETVELIQGNVKQTLDF